MERVSNRVNTENNDSIQLPPPPPYTTVVYKLDETEFDRIPPPSYTEIENQSVVYINNYPGPPLTDGNVQVTLDNTPINRDTVLSKKVRIYLILNGILTVIFGCVAVGVQIGILASNSIIYYYYGFWGGALIIGIGLSAIMLYYNNRGMNHARLFHSFFWQMIIIAIVLGVGVAIMLTDKCNDNATDDNGDDESCKKSYKVLNGFLIGSFAASVAQSIINIIVFGILNRHYSNVSNSFSR